MTTLANLSQAEYVQAYKHRPAVLEEYRRTLGIRLANAKRSEERADIRAQINSFDAECRAQGVQL